MEGGRERGGGVRGEGGSEREREGGREGGRERYGEGIYDLFCIVCAQMSEKLVGSCL